MSAVAQVAAGRCSFDLELGSLRVRIADLPTAWDPFVPRHYAPFAEPSDPGRPVDLCVACRADESAGEIVPLPPPGGSTVIELERLGPRAFTVRSHWQDGWIDLDRGRGELRLVDRAWDRFALSLENFLRVALQLAAVERGAFLLHSAGVVDAGRAFLFFGHSGAGKSTATAFSAPRPALSDDLVLIEADAAQVVARAVPFMMAFAPEQRARGRFPIAAALRLRQAPDDRLAPLSPAVAVATLSASVPFVHELGLPHAGLTALVARVAAAVPVRDLHFTRSARFWELLEREFPAGHD